jgi:tetratricopeptide (TPR) repeat protein
MGDNYEHSGMTGAVGRNNDVHDNTFTQNIYEAATFTPSALHQLPPPPRDFVGRSKEMTELLQAVENSGVSISGLQGLGGIGKTALALKLAQHLESKYPDAQFYLDLKGASKQPLSPGEAMAHVIRAYHPTAQLPEDESSLQTIYLSELKGKKALLLMDNAASREQVLPLIPPPGCLLLVTSRTHFMLNGLVAKNLEALEAADAKQLLLKIAPRIGKCAEKIAELCGYLPMALELAASALHQFVMLTPEEYVQRLSDATKRLELVEASLSLSYDLLTEELQTLWRILAVFPNTFDTAAVAALWDLEVEKTQERLGELISYSLLEWNDTTRRYRLHDLLKLLAQARLNQEERYAAGKHHAIYYREVLTQAGGLYREGSNKITKGLALFDLERENIDSGQDWAAINADDKQGVTRLSMEYFNAAYDLLGLRLHPRERIRWLEISLKAACKLDDKTFQGYSLGNLGNAYNDLGETHKAIQFQEQALLIYRETGNRRGEGITLGNLGLAYANLGETRKAIELYDQQLMITREIGFRLVEGKALNNLGIAYKDLGETRKAIELYEQRLEIAREIGDRRGEGMTLGNLGNAYYDLGETRKALKFQEQQLLIARNIGDLRNEGNALWNSAVIYEELGDRALAISLAEKALVIYEQIEAPGVPERRAILDDWKAKKHNKFNLFTSLKRFFGSSNQ